MSAVEDQISAKKDDTAVIQDENVATKGSEDSGDAQEKHDRKQTFLRSGQVTVSGKERQLELTAEGLKLTGLTGKDSEGISLTWRDVVRATTDPQGTGEEQHKTFFLYYVHHGAKYQLRLRSLKIVVKDAQSESWISAIHERCSQVEGRPQKVFVIVNPIGGAGNGRQIYHKTVAPILERAEIHTTVVVTERSKHALELGEGQDFSTYDAIVVVGGDGLYQEVLQGLFVQTQRKTGVDYRNAEASPTKLNIPIAIIPAGTGNGLSGVYNGIIDAETAALSIVRGEIHRAQMYTIYSQGKFVCVSALLVGYGDFSAVIKRSEELRWMKRARYPYVLLGMFFTKKRSFNCEVKYRQLKEQKDEEDSASMDVGAAAGTIEDWITYNSEAKQMRGILTFVTDFLEDGDHYLPTAFGESVWLMLNMELGALGLLKALFSMSKGKNLTSVPNKVEYIKKVTDIKVKVLRDETKAKEELSAAEAKDREMELVLDVDGEVVYLEEPEMELRLHTSFIPVFGRLRTPATEAKATK